MKSGSSLVPHKPDRDRIGSVIYVVRLVSFQELARRDQEKLLELNPAAKADAPVFYVGQTALLAQQRYENHRNGYKSSRWVKKYGRNLITVDEWEPDFGIALPREVVRAAWELARRSQMDPSEREAAMTGLLRAQGCYVISH